MRIQGGYLRFKYILWLDLLEDEILSIIFQIFNTLGEFSYLNRLKNKSKIESGHFPWPTLYMHTYTHINRVLIVRIPCLSISNPEWSSLLLSIILQLLHRALENVSHIHTLPIFPRSRERIQICLISAGRSCI